jgi:hypothetical protein
MIGRFTRRPSAMNPAERTTETTRAPVKKDPLVQEERRTLKDRRAATINAAEDVRVCD